MDGQRGRCGPYAAQYAQHSLTGTVQSSTRGLSSLVRHSPFCLISHSYPSYLATSLVLWPSIIIIDILYRGLYFIHVSHRGMRLFGILYASLLPQSLYFPPSSFFPPVIWSAKSLFSFFLCTFFEIMMPRSLKIIANGWIRQCLRRDNNEILYRTCNFDI